MQAAGGLRARVEKHLWPLLEVFVASQPVAGVAVAVVREEEGVARGFGVRDVRSGEPVTPGTMFHLASVSKPFVATAVVSLATARDGGEAALDLDAPIVEWIPEFTLADGRAAAVTARTLLSHTSGLPDVTDYGWHDPQLSDDALSEFARSLSGWRLQSDPGAAFSYSNAGYELLGLLLARATGTTFEKAMRQQLLHPLGIHDSTFLRSELTAGLAAAPHVGMPLTVPEAAYPYTRRHAPSSTLHSNLVEMVRWVQAHFDSRLPAVGGDRQRTRLDPALVDLMWRPVVPVGHPPWEVQAALGWSVGRYGGLRTLSHSGMDPGFASRVVLVPERQSGVVVLANSNTVPASAIAKAALDIVLPHQSAGPADHEWGEGVAAVRALRPPVVCPVAETMVASGADAAVTAFRRLATGGSTDYDLDDDGFSDAVWGAIELHRTSMVWPLLRVWTTVRPGSSAAWTMTGWAHQVDGELDLARRRLRRALDLDPGNDEAALLMRNLDRPDLNDRHS